MSENLEKFSNEELLLIYKNQNCNENEQSLDNCSSYDDENHYSVSIYTRSSNGCFITTAVCETFGKPDNCQELTAFRHFRDTYMKEEKNLQSEVSKYYEIAPRICAAIDAKGVDAAKQEYARIWDEYLSKAFEALNNNDLEKTHTIYKDMVLSLEKDYLN